MPATAAAETPLTEVAEPVATPLSAGTVAVPDSEPVLEPEPDSSASEPPEPAEPVSLLEGEETPVPEAVEVAEAPEEEALGVVLKVDGQVRSKRGVVERFSVIANFISLSGFESRRLYQKVGTLPNSLRQPTSCQKNCEFLTVASALSQVWPM